MIKTVLVVEDDIDLRATLARVLAAAGFATLLACDGQEALDWIAARVGDPPDAILLDLEMPRVSGWQVISAVRSQQPSLLGRILVLSARPSALPPDVAVLLKPSSPQSIVERLRSLLAGAGPSA